MDVPLQEDGESAYFATLPVKAIAKNVREHGIPCLIFYSAGTYVCNCVMYNVLYIATKKYPNIRAGFIHVPFEDEQVVSKPNGTPSMSLEVISKSLEYAIEATVKNEKDITEVVGGTTH